MALLSVEIVCVLKRSIAVMWQEKLIGYASESGRPVQKSGQFGSDRQMDHKSRALSQGTFNFNLSAVLGDHLMGDRQP